MLQISKLTYRYPNSAAIGLAVPAFSLAPGAHAIILGPSGCGKSTLLHLIAAILMPQQGVLRVAGTDVTSLSPRTADAWRGKTIGFLPQKLALVASLSVREDLLLAAHGARQTADITCAGQLLRELGLSDKAGAKFEAAKLFRLLGVGIDVLRGIAAIVLAAAALSMFVALYNALEERKTDLAILRTLGAQPAKLLLLLTEAAPASAK